jgi:hypothetical protein
MPKAARNMSSSLSLVSDADRLALGPHRHVRRSFLRTDGTRLVLVLDEGDPLSPRNQSDFLEAFEPTKYSGKALLVRGIGQVPQEKDLVGRKVLVGNDSCCCTGGRFEARALDCLGWTRCVGRTRGPLELLLSFQGFVGLFALYQGQTQLAATCPNTKRQQKIVQGEKRRSKNAPFSANRLRL